MKCDFDLTFDSLNMAREKFKEDCNINGESIQWGDFTDKDGNFPSEYALDKSIAFAKKDISVRTLHSDNDQNQYFPKKSKFSTAKFTDLKKELVLYFHKKTKGDFETWHFRVCSNVLDEIQQCYPNSKVEFGKAQKLVNMTFKYLYCFDDAVRKYNNFFNPCHMPLDTVILEWIKREKKGTNDFKATNIPKWSNMKYSSSKSDRTKKDHIYTYKELESFVVDILPKQDEGSKVLTPLQAEFIIWPQMQLKLSAEEFLKRLEDNGYYVSSKEDPYSLYNDLKCIQLVLDNSLVSK